jgi:DNA repair protein RadC
MTDPAAAELIATTGELMRAISRQGIARSTSLGTSRAALDYLSLHTGFHEMEEFRVLYVDGASRLIADEVAFNGDLSECAAHPRPIVIRALDLGADGIIVAHNHPAGNPAPSRADIDATRRLSKACDTIGIRLRDHLILSGGDWYSFRENGLL